MAKVTLAQLFAGVSDIAEESQTIRVAHGSESFDGSTVKVYHNLLEGGRRVFPNKIFRAYGNSVSSPCSTLPAVNGTFYQYHLIVPRDGSILQIGANALRSGSYIRNAALFLRLRKNAPRYRVEATLTRSSKSLIGHTVTVFEGHADLMEAEDVAMEGYDFITPAWIKQNTNRDELLEGFRVEMLEPALSPPPVMEIAIDKTGAEVRIAARRRRKTNLR